MRKQVVFIHSAGKQGLHEGSEDLVNYLIKELGDEYEVCHPLMPEPENPRYFLWKDKLDQELKKVSGNIILVGHSLGASVLLKYLSEENCSFSVDGLFLVSAAYWGVKDWEIEEYTLQSDFKQRLPLLPHVFLYHSRDDEWVPFVHLWHYTVQLPHANIRILEGNEHEFFDGLPVLVRDIKNIKR